MDKKTHIHDNIMTFLDNYLKETPREQISKEVAEISQINFAGTTAKDYFYNFHKYYHQVEIPEVAIKIIQPVKILGKVKKLSKVNGLKDYFQFYISDLQLKTVHIQDFNALNEFHPYVNKKQVKKYNYV